MGEARDRAAGRKLRVAAAALLALTLAAGVLPVVAAAAQAAPPLFVVDTTADAVDAALGDGACDVGDGTCTLRGAVGEANALGGGTVQLPSGTFALTGGRGGDTGDLDLTAPVSIEGQGATTVIQGAGDRVLDVQAPGVVITGVAITGGSARDGAGINVAAAGGLTLVESTVAGNTASNEGGGIRNAGTLVVRRSTIDTNVADRRGGGLYNSAAATIENATIHGNRANAGGGVISTGSATLVHVTISVNTSTNRLGGGLQNQGGVVDVRASIIADNISNGGDAKDCSGSPALQGLNLIGNVSGCNPTGTQPLDGASGLAATLAFNGGPTRTQALLPASQALNQLAAPCLLPVDQRGVPRPSGPGCDLGAYELQALGLGLTLDSTVPEGGLGAGAATVPLDALRQAATGPVAVPAGTTGTALRSIALRSIALRSIALRSIALRSIALRSIALRSIALRSIALRSIFTASADLQSTALRSIALRSILLSDVEVDGGWEALLDGTPFQDVPLQNLTLEDVSGLSQVQALTLADTDLSATRIGSLSIVSLLLETTALRSIPLEGVASPATDEQLVAAWCGLLDATPCPITAADLDLSLLSLELAGTALRSIALRSILLAGLDLSASALRSIPLSELAPGSLPDIVDCTKVDCTVATTTLGDADVANALRGTMADLLLALLGDQDFGWEGVDLEGGGVQAIADGPEPTVTFEAGVDLQGGAPADVALTITLPVGFAYQPGSARLDGATVADPAIAGQVLTFTLTALPAGGHELTIAAWAGLHLGAATATAQATATNPSGTASSPLVSEDVTVGEAFEEPVPADDQRPIGDDRLHIAHLSFPTDVDLYAFDVTADDARNGTTASIRLANLPADYDLALYGPPLDPLRNTPSERRDLLPDHQLDLAAGDDNLTAEPTADVPQALPFAAPEVIHRISARRSSAAEQIDTGSLRAGRYWVQVSGANGATSPLPYSLQLRLDTGIDRGICAAATFPFTMPGPSGAPDTSARGLDTVFLVNARRLAAAYGDQAATVLTRLQALAGAADLGIHGAVIAVDGDADVNSAYGAWDADRCSADAANQVVRQIGDLVDEIRTTNPEIENVVLVGDDLQVPFARVPDATRLSNEQSFADTFAGNNELVAAFAGGFVLTDNAYGTSRGIAVNDHELFVPELAVGRLVETPAEIVDAVDRFTAAGGVLDPDSALVTGYDFLADGADAVSAALGGATELIDETWDRAALTGALAALDAPAVASINAHFDHSRLLPALGNSTNDESDLFSTADITGAVETALTDALLFSMGCHSGLAVSDITVGAVVPDWAQTFADVAGGWVANTGFGYGDTELVALSEDLMARFAARLVAGDSAGIALATAKAEYAAAVALVSPYDEKVVHEATLYGLPMLRMQAAPTAAVAAPATTAALEVEPPLLHDPRTGLQAAEHDLTFSVGTVDTQIGPNVLTPAGSDDGKWFHIEGGTLNQAHRPVQPRTTVDVGRAGDGAPQARGVLVTELTSIDIDGFDPLFFSPTVDAGEHEPRSVAADATFPARFVDVTSTNGPGGRDERLVVVPGQFRRTAVPGIGTQRLFTHVGTLVYYGDGASAGGPPIGVRHTTAEADGGIARFLVELDGAAERVYVLYKQTGTDATWTGIDLAPGPGNSWFGAGAGSDPREYIVQTVSSDGRVSWATSKGDDFGSVPGGETGEVSITVTPAPTAGWHRTPVSVSITGGAGLEFSLDSGPFITYTGAFTIEGNGFHSVVARDNSGALDTAFVAIDTAAPTVTATQEPLGVNGWVAPGGATVTLEASDGAGSGVASISYRIGDGATTTVPGDTATVDVSSTATVTFTATDVAGNTSAEQTHTVQVDAIAPTIDCGGVDTQWHDANVTRSCTASDGQSGLADAGDASFTLSTNVADGAASATAPTGTRQVCDALGNCATAGPLSFKVDRADPTITITSPVDGADVTRGDALVADYACADVGSGVAAVDCTARIGTTSYADGATLPTGTGGSFTLTVTAVDRAGNQSTATATYHVAAYDICLLYDPEQATRIGSAYPIKIRLCDAAGNNLSSRSIEIRAIRIDELPPIDEGSSNDGNVFRYDARSRSYIYNLDTNGLAVGSHELELSVDGVTAGSYVAPFSVR